MVSDSSTKAFSKVPVLGDIPFLGRAFRHESKERAKKNLIVFITPSIVGDDDFQPDKSDFLKTKFKGIDEEKETAWDSGKPIDWSKPVAPGKTRMETFKD